MSGGYVIITVLLSNQPTENWRLPVFKGLSPLNLKITTFRIGRNGRCDRMGQAGFFYSTITQENDMKEKKTFWELAKNATYHEWSEWFFEHGSDTLFFAVGMIVAILVTNLLSTAPAIFAAGFMLIVGIVFFVGSFHLKDNHNQVK